MLKKITTCASSSGFEKRLFGQISSCVSYLQNLSLCIHYAGDLKNIDFPELPKLKILKMNIEAWEDNSLLEYTSLAKVAPNLQRIMIQLVWRSPARRRRKIRQAPNHRHENLKVVELVGYYGRTTDLELAVYFIENAIALKKLVIDPRYHGTRIRGNERLKKEKAARTCAKQQLPPRTPQAVKLIIL